MPPDERSEGGRRAAVDLSLEITTYLPMISEAHFSELHDIRQGHPPAPRSEYVKCSLQTPQVLSFPIPDIVGSQAHSSRVVMVVVMTGSPNASAYPEPSAKVFAARAQKELDTNQQRADKFKELQAEKKAKAKKQAEAKKAKKAAEDAKFKARQDDMRSKQQLDRDDRAATRAESLAKIAAEHDGWVHREEAREQQRVEQGRQRTKDMLDGVHYEDEIEAAAAAITKKMKDDSKKALAEQRAQDEANEAERQAKMKADRCVAHKKTAPGTRALAGRSLPVTRHHGRGVPSKQTSACALVRFGRVAQGGKGGGATPGGAEEARRDRQDRQGDGVPDKEADGPRREGAAPKGREQGGGAAQARGGGAQEE